MSAHYKSRDDLEKAAIQRYLDVIGEGAMYPARGSSTLSRNGTVFLRNVRGQLAVVTSKGKVYDRICGERLDVSVLRAPA